MADMNLQQFEYYYKLDPINSK